MAQKSFHRTDRVSAQLRRELGTLVHQAVREHGLASTSVSDKAKETVKALKALAPEIRFQLARAVKMRHVPELHFHYDDSVDKGERIDQLLRDPDGA